MRAYRLGAFGIEHLTLESFEPRHPAAGEVVLDVKALSLNHRDLMVVKGTYNPKLRLPATPISDGAGVISAVGQSVTRVKAGDRVCSHFVADWIDGPFKYDYVKTSLGTPGAGLAAEQVVLPAEAVVRIPADYTFAQAATLPIAALTAWSSLKTVADVTAGQTLLTLGTGGVSIFALQFAKAFGATVIVTSSSDKKLERARELGADHTVNYETTPHWHKAVLELTGGRGVDLVVETGGAGTLDQSMMSCAAGATVAILGALAGLKADVMTALILMGRLSIRGVYVDSRRRFEEMIGFIDESALQPVIDSTFSFEQLPDALRHMEAGMHFGKIVVEI